MPTTDSNVLPRAVLHWIQDALGSGTTIQSGVRLAGATSSELHHVRARFGGADADLVLRLFVKEDWLREEPDLAVHEAASLAKACETGLPTPELVAIDSEGRQCGVPAVLMTKLPGQVELAPHDLENWLVQLAAALVSIHAVDADAYVWSYFTYNDISRLETPGWSTCPELWKKAIEIVQGTRPEVAERFIHRDYHQTNVLWQSGKISGVVDWVNACRGPAGIDLGHCRWNLAGLYGVTAADTFLDAYLSLAGDVFRYDAYWDLISVIEGLPGPPDVYAGWVAFGVRHLDDNLMRERADAYLTSLMARA
jgi:aminoglycoside phosphotransferase (APT) family kinase protein